MLRLLRPLPVPQSPSPPVPKLDRPEIDSPPERNLPMKTRTRAIAIAPILLAGAFCVATAASVPSPSEFLGFEVGADKKLADYRQIAKYFQALKAASPRVDIQVLGKTTLGEDMFMAIISSEENIKNARRIREIAKRLADPRGLSNAEAERLEKEGKVVLLVTCNIH